MSPRSPHLRQRPNSTLSTLALIELAYEAAANSSLWPRWFEELASGLDQRVSNLVVRGFGPTRYVSLDVPEPGFRTMNSSRVFQNKALSRRSFAIAWIDDEIVEEWSRLRPEGSARDGIEVFSDPSRSIRPTDRRLLRAVLPHLHRALSLYFRLDAAQRNQEAFGACLDAFFTGMVILDQHAVVLHANRAATEYLSDGTGLLQRNGKLGFFDPDRDGHLHRLLTTALSGRRVGLACLKLGDGATLWLRGLGPNRAVAHLVSDRNQRALAPELLADALDLTPSEARVGALFASGLSVDEMAASLGVSVHTVRLHIKNMQHKTGTRRQATLLRRMLETIPPITP